MKAKHTKEKWKIGERIFVDPKETNGWIKIILDDPEKFLTIADVQYWQEEGVDEAEANAKLIAAAPELLEALQDIVDQAEKTKMQLPADLADSIKILGKQAIKKATS